jgi:hypothetical protein
MPTFLYNEVMEKLGMYNAKMGKVADIICCLFLVPVFAGVVTRLLRKK